MKKRLTNVALPLCGIGLALAAWWMASRYVADLPSPLRTWEESKLYILEPLTKRGETDQGLLLLPRTPGGGEQDSCSDRPGTPLVFRWAPSPP